MMFRDVIRFINPLAVVRLVVWITPAHRKDWAQAMLNELAYIESRRAAVRWITGSMLFAIRARVVHELEKASVNRLSQKVSVLIVVAICVVAGIYAVQKPYKQERIKFVLHRVFDTN